MSRPLQASRRMGKASAEPAPAVAVPADPPSRFDLAAVRAHSRYTAEQWALLEPRRRSAAIYSELRRLDSAAQRD